VQRGLARTAERLTSLGKLLAAVNPNLPLDRGFARVHRADGSLVHRGAALERGEEVALVFTDAIRQAVIDGAGGPPRPAKPARTPGKPAPAAQGDLF
jgi:exodeoxyribonuclease VII large subunit